MRNEIEILVSNNGSEDNTHEAVTALGIKYPFITYNRNPENIGGTPNVILSMELASAEYLIFLGDDDRIKEGSLKRIVEFLKSNKDAGLLIDSSNFKKKPSPQHPNTLTTQELLTNYYWNIGNAGVFVVRSSYIKECINKYGLGFFNQCWPQTQFMILGLQQHPNDRIYLDDFSIISHSVHGEVTIYNSYYLWISTYYDLFRAINDLENCIDKEIVLAAKQYLRNNIVQLLFNFLQCGVYIDTPEIRIKTRKHIQKNLALFSSYEKRFLIIGIVTLGLPTFLSRFLCDVFIFLLKGKAGIIKKNEFVKAEKNKINLANKSKSISVRELALEE